MNKPANHTHKTVAETNPKGSPRPIPLPLNQTTTNPFFSSHPKKEAHRDVVVLRPKPPCRESPAWTSKQANDIPTHTPPYCVLLSKNATPDVTLLAALSGTWISYSAHPTSHMPFTHSPIHPFPSVVPPCSQQERVKRDRVKGIRRCIHPSHPMIKPPSHQNGGNLHSNPHLTSPVSPLFRSPPCSLHSLPQGPLAHVQSVGSALSSVVPLHHTAAIHIPPTIQVFLIVPIPSPALH